MSKKVVWHPMPGKIVAKEIGDSEFLGSGLILRAASHAKPRTTAEVVAVYDAFLNDDGSESESFLKVGDRIVFGQHSGVELNVAGEKVIILRENEILTKIEVSDPDLIPKIGVAAGEFDDLGG